MDFFCRLAREKNASLTRLMFQFSFEVWLNPLPVDFSGLLCGLGHVLSRCQQQRSVTQSIFGQYE